MQYTPALLLQLSHTDLMREIVVNKHSLVVDFERSDSIHHRLRKFLINSLLSVLHQDQYSSDIRQLPPEAATIVTPIKPSFMACTLKASNSDFVTVLSDAP
jgi:hypothetical protein